MNFPQMEVTVILIHTFSTLYMTGLIWFVQVVHYPLKSSVGHEAFKEYQRLHVMKTGWVVGPPMLMEAASAIWLGLLLLSNILTDLLNWRHSNPPSQCLVQLKRF